MSPVTHFLAGWMVANFADRRRDRILITLAGVAPDLDGLGIVPELLTSRSSHSLTWFSDYHHLLGHNIGFALLTSLAAYMISGRKWKIAVLAFLSFHLHLLCDLVGARGPDGYQWPIPYLLPFSKGMDLVWKGQWMLNAWPNFAFTIFLLVTTFYLAWSRGFSLLEIFSQKADRAFVDALRNRFLASETTAPTTPA